MNALARETVLRRIGADGGSAARLLRRAGVQIEFARGLAALHNLPDPTPEAERVVAAATTFAELETAVAEAERLLAPLAETAKTYAIHCVGHGHIDMNWMWSWPETVAATHDTFASVLSFMDEYPDLTYSQSQTSVYALMERYHPALFERIRERVREGRWEVTATEWVEGDKNLANGESLARQMVLSRAWFADKLGLSPEDVPVSWNPDTFGHANTVPSVLHAGGVRYYYACRLGGGFDHAITGGPRPPLFWWEGPDGARLLVNRETTWYNSYIGIGENIALPLLDFARETGLKDWLNVFGLGNHGGGPTRVEIEYLRETMAWPVFPRVLFSTAKRYFETIAPQVPADLPVLAHELNYEFTGCYTSQSAIKRANRLGENYCLEAETVNLVSGALGAVPAGAAVNDAWIEVLFNQFHDILPGSGVTATRERAMAAFQEAAAITGAAKRRFATLLASRVDTQGLLPPDAPREDNDPFAAGAGNAAAESGFSPSHGGGDRFRPYVVWNALPWDRDDLVRVDVYDAPWDPSRVVATDDEGRSVRVLVVDRDPLDWGHSRVSYVFAARGVPGLGYRTYLLHEGSPTPDEPTVGTSERERFDTPAAAFQLDRYGTGFTDAEGRTLGVWTFVNEIERGMSSWALGKETGHTPLAADAYELHGAWRHPGSGASLGRGPCYLAVRRAKAGTKSHVAVRALIHPLGRRLDFQADLDWREIGTHAEGIPGLTIDFPVSGEDALVFETPFGTVERPAATSEEVPTLRFVHLPKANLTILQDCKYGHAVSAAGVRIRVVRSSFEPDLTPEVGRSKVRYAVIRHETPPTRAELARLGAEFDRPMLAFPATVQTGDLPTTRGFARTEGTAVVTALKPAEDGRGWIVRLADYDGTGGETTLVLDPTLVPDGARAETTDLLERPVEGSARIEGNRLTLTVLRAGVATVRVSAG